MTLTTNLDAVRSAVRAMTMPPSAAEKTPAATRPTITISRPHGIDVGDLTRRLTQTLDRALSGDPPWLAYDRELVERVASDHNIEADLVARLDEHDKTWFEHFTAGIAATRTGTDVPIKIAQTIRGLAHVGHAIVVGRGGQCVLGGMRHAAHVRLTAPLAWRVERYASAHGLSANAAETAVRSADRERARFISNHFHVDVTDVDLYDAVLNVERLSLDVMVDVITRMVTDLAS